MSFDLTPYKSRLLAERASEANLSSLELNRKSNPARADKITSPIFLKRDGKLRMEDPFKQEKTAKEGPAKEGIPECIRLPALIPVKRVTSTNQFDSAGLADLREKKLLRRRLNSEDEKSLISLSKMEVIFGGRERAERKVSLNGEFQNPKNRWKDKKSQVIYDKRVSTQRKTSGRKKSEDLGLRLRIRSVVDLVETRNRSENSDRQQLSSQIICSVQDSTNGQIAPSIQSQNEGGQSRIVQRTVRKDSENACDGEQENTKGSSFNTDKGTKEKRWMNQLLDHSDQQSDARKRIRSNDKEPKSNNIFKENRIRAKGAKLRELSKRGPLDENNLKVPPRRKSSYVSQRRDSLIVEKSDFDNVSEAVGFESHLGSIHRRIAQHQNIGSQISEESVMNLDIEIENLNIWRGKGEDEESSELHWQIRFLELLDKDKFSQRSRKQSEVILRDHLKGSFGGVWGQVENWGEPGTATNPADATVAQISTIHRKPKKTTKLQKTLTPKKKSKTVTKRVNQTLIGKRDSFEKDAKPVKLLTKKQRRNKHCKQNLDWLLEANEENRKKKPNGGSRENKQMSTTKFVLKKDTQGMGICFSGNPKRVKHGRVTSGGAQKERNTIQLSRETEKPGIINMKRGTTGQVSLKLAPKNEGKAKGGNKSTGQGKPKDSKLIPKMVWNSRGQCDEVTKLRSKINKVRTYWNRTSLLIPNVFRHVCELKGQPTQLFEYLDLSKKELLVQANGQKAVSQAGAPHLQRKNKKVAKNDSLFSKNMKPKTSKPNEADQNSENLVPISQELSQSEMKWNEPVQKKREELDKGKKPENVKAESRKWLPKKQKQAKEVPEKRSEYVRTGAGGIGKGAWEKENNLEKKLDRMKKQLREDLSRADQKIKNSFVSKNKEDWTKTDLENFNNNISKYNQLLDEQEKLRILNVKGSRKGKTSATTKHLILGQASFPMLNQKLDRKSIDRVKQQISAYVKRNKLAESQMNGDSPEKKPQTTLTMQDILQFELRNSGAKKGPSGSVPKLSKRIQKKPVEQIKKKVFSTTNNAQVSSKKSQSKKRANQTGNHGDSELQRKRKSSEEIEILAGVEDKELVVSVNAESLEELTEESVCSLDEFIRRRK